LFLAAAFAVGLLLIGAFVAKDTRVILAGGGLFGSILLVCRAFITTYFKKP
jgi:hypothetical protein